MSNRKSARQLRREWWILCIRERPEGREVNRSHCMRIDDDLRDLIKEGVVIRKRGHNVGSRFCITRRTIVTMADGSINPPGPIICPDCKRGAERSNHIVHKGLCAIGGHANRRIMSDEHNHTGKGKKRLHEVKLDLFTRR